MEREPVVVTFTPVKIWLLLIVKLRGAVATWRVMLCETEPLDAVTVTLYSPLVPLALTVKVDVAPQPETVAVLGLIDAVGPVELGTTEAARLIVPVNPFRGSIVIVDVPESPLCTVKSFGFADRVKSTTSI
jgi:hypothetical protein